MTNEIRERYPNGVKKHVIRYHDNGTIYSEQFYDEDGYFHRENGLPDYQEWHKNGMIMHITYSVHGQNHNIYSPAYISFISNGKIWQKTYYLKNTLLRYTKLNWQNQIKNI